MPINDGLTLDEAKRVAVLGGEAQVELVVPALLALYDEVRRLEGVVLGYEPGGSSAPAYRATTIDKPWRPGA